MATYPASGVAPYLDKYPITERDSRAFTRSAVLDFAALKAKKILAGTPGDFAAADVIQAVPVFAGELVENVIVKTVTPATNAAVIGVGDGTDPDGYFANTTAVGTGSSAGAAVQVTAGAYRFTTTNVTSLGKLYTADDSIDVLIGATVPADGVIEVVVVLKQIYSV